MLISQAVMDDLDRLVREFPCTGTIVSRSAIEDYLQDHRDEYQALTGLCRRTMRQAISCSFSKAYPLWREGAGRSPRTPCWVTGQVRTAEGAYATSL